MWDALLTVAALSLLISSALAAIATYLYFFGTGDTAEKEFPAIATDEDPADRQSAQAAQDFLQSAASHNQIPPTAELCSPAIPTRQRGPTAHA
jgi:hypothetical protein